VLEPVIQFFERLISDFSWRRLMLLAAILGLTTAAVWAYESYTGSLRLARIEKEVSLLERLAAVGGQPTVANDPKLLAIYHQLQGKLSGSTTLASTPTLLSTEATKALAALAAWLVLACFGFVAGRMPGGTEFTASTALGMAVVATPFVVLAAFLPTFQASWINYFLYPVGHVVLVVAVVLLWHRRSA